MAEKVACPDQKLSEIASRQHGVVTIGQLRAAGLTDDAVLGRVRQGRLHRVHRGVYAVGYRGTTCEHRWMAAALACRCGVVSHRSAAALWGLLAAIDGSVDISVPGQTGRAKRQGIRLHRCPSLLATDMTRRRGIPVTSPVRTISDLRRVVSARELRRAIRQAEVFGLSIGPGTDRDRTRSDLERAFLQLCRRHRLPAPEVNVRAGPHLVDFLWRDRSLIVETDGYRYHRGRQAFEDDRARDLDLRARGFAVVRLSEKQVAEEPGLVAGILRAAVATSRRRVARDAS